MSASFKPGDGAGATANGSSEHSHDRRRESNSASSRGEVSTKRDCRVRRTSDLGLSDSVLCDIAADYYATAKRGLIVNGREPDDQVAARWNRKLGCDLTGPEVQRIAAEDSTTDKRVIGFYRLSAREALANESEQRKESFRTREHRVNQIIERLTEGDAA